MVEREVNKKEKIIAYAIIVFVVLAATTVSANYFGWMHALPVLVGVEVVVFGVGLLVSVLELMDKKGEGGNE